MVVLKVYSKLEKEIPKSTPQVLSQMDREAVHQKIVPFDIFTPACLFDSSLQTLFLLFVFFLFRDQIFRNPDFFQRPNFFEIETFFPKPKPRLFSETKFFRNRNQDFFSETRPILCHILTFFDPPCQPGQIFWVQNSLYRCPTYSTTCFMLNSHLLGVF